MITRATKVIIPIFPEVFPVDQAHKFSAVSEWVSRFPEQGNVRKISLEALKKGYIPEVAWTYEAKGNLGQIQRHLDNGQIAFVNNYRWALMTNIIRLC